MFSICEKLPKNIFAWFLKLKVASVGKIVALGLGKLDFCVFIVTCK